MAIGKRPPRIFVRLRGSNFRHLRSNSSPSIHYDFQFSRGKWQFVTENHQYQQKVTFWNLICRYVFVKSDEKWQKNVFFFLLFVFFQENISSIHWENRFRKVHEIIQMPSFWAFQSDRVINLQCFDGHSLLSFQVLEKLCFLSRSVCLLYFHSYFS